MSDLEFINHIWQIIDLSKRLHYKDKTVIELELIYIIAVDLLKDFDSKLKHP